MFGCGDANHRLRRVSQNTRVALGLRDEKVMKAKFAPRNRHITRGGLNNLQEGSLPRAPFMELTSRVEKSGAKSERHRPAKRVLK